MNHHSIEYNNTQCGGDSEKDTPVPMPNTEVKPLNADGTWMVTSWESRKSPVKFKHLINLIRCFLMRKDTLRLIDQK